MAEETIVTDPVVVTADAPVVEAKVDTPVTDASSSTLLGQEIDAEGNPVVKEKPKAEVTETPEQKTAREATEAENKKLLETEDKDLTPEQLAKKQDLVKAEAAKVPEKYEVKVEGFEIDSKILEGLTPVFKKHNLTQAAVQELATAYAPLVQAQVEAQQKAAIDGFQKTVDGWKQETDKFLGAEPAKEMRFAAKFLNKFGTPELRAMFNETGTGNHPELVKALIKAGKAISEDAFVEGTKTTGGEVSLYDHPTSKATLTK